MDKFSNLIIKRSSSIARIKLNEPNNYNALTFKTLKSLVKIFKIINNDQKIKVVIIEGLGKGFSAGHDLKEIKSLKKKFEYQKLFN